MGSPFTRNRVEITGLVSTALSNAHAGHMLDIDAIGEPKLLK